MTRSPVPDVVHHFSHVTGVSLELPVAFEQVAEDDVQVTYADVDDERPDAGGPVVRVTVLGVLDAEETDERRAAAVGAVAEGLAGNGEVLTRTTHAVDGEPAETVVVRGADGLVLHQTATASPVRLLTVLGTVDEPALADAYDRAVASIRFVDL